MYGSSREFAELLALTRLGCSVNISTVQMAQLSLLPDVPVKLAGDGRGIDPSLACPGALYATAWGSTTRWLT
jgi:hypothetical protein